MATADTLQGEPGAAQRTVLANCLGGILGTAWRKSAMIAEKRAEHQLVAPDQ